MPTQNKYSIRLFGLDKLRVALTFLVIAHHAAQAYGPTGGGWPIFNDERSAILGPFFSVNAAFFMGLFFLIAGYFVPAPYERKGVNLFLKDRLVRLGTPVIFFALFVFGPISFFSLESPHSATEFIQYLYSTGWQAIYAHLWFLLHLILYSFIFCLFSKILLNSRPKQSRFTNLTSSKIFAYTICLALITWFVRIWFPIDKWVALFFLVPAEIAHLPQYFSLFIIGAISYRNGWYERTSSNVGFAWLAIGVIASVLYYWYRLVGMDFLPRLIAKGGLNWKSFVWSSWEAFICVGFCVGLPILFREYFNSSPSRIVRKLVVAAYGAYIIHVLIVVGVQTGLHDFDLSPLLKFCLVTITGILISFSLSYLLKLTPGIRKII